MSQLADLVDVVNNTPLPPVERGKLLFAILQALGWDGVDVESAADAEVFLTLNR